jgi:hypothetical protein
MANRGVGIRRRVVVAAAVLGGLLPLGVTAAGSPAEATDGTCSGQGWVIYGVKINISRICTVVDEAKQCLKDHECLPVEPVIHGS